MKKRTLLPFVLVIVFISLMSLGAYANEQGGECGETLRWTLSDDGTLTISGDGSMDNYDPENAPAPWAEFADDITAVTVESGAENLGEYAFFECSRLANMAIPESVTIPEGVTEIDIQVFYNCESLETVTIPASVTSIGKTPSAPARG